MIYELFYWPGIQGRGELPRLLLEDAGVPYDDVCQRPEGLARMQQIMHGEGAPLMPFAPPFLHAGGTWISHTAAIISFLGERLGVAPRDEQERVTARTLALTLADLLTEVHDTHHPITIEQDYEKQQDAALRRAAAFRDLRMPKFLRYLERTITINRRRGGGGVIVGVEISYVDIAAYQILQGLEYAFPRALARVRGELSQLYALHSRVSVRPRLAAYVASPRRAPFNEEGIFRRYPELDG